MKKITLITNWSCALSVFKIPMLILTDNLQGNLFFGWDCKRKNAPVINLRVLWPEVCSQSLKICVPAIQVSIMVSIRTLNDKSINHSAIFFMQTKYMYEEIIHTKTKEVLY